MSTPFQTTAENTRALWHAGALLRVKATGDDTGGEFALIEHTCREGAAAPLHVHVREDEAFLVLDGELRIDVEDRTFRAEAGSFTYAPRGLPHAYRVVSPTCRFLSLITPAGFERWFFDTGEPAGSLTLPSPPSEDELAVLADAVSGGDYGVEILGPPPGGW